MDEQRTTARRTYDQACPVAHALDLVGERWTLLIVRDLLFAPLRFTDLRDGLPGLAPNLLSDRLRFLRRHGIIEQVVLPSPAARTVYVLTPRGRGLAPVVHELARFGVADWDDPDGLPPPPRLRRGALLALMAPERMGPASWTATVELPDTTVGITVAPAAVGLAPLQRLRLADPPLPEVAGPHAAVRASLGTLLALRRATLTRARAEAGGQLSIYGSARAQKELGLLLGWT